MFFKVFIKRTPKSVNSLQSANIFMISKSSILYSKFKEFNIIIEILIIKIFLDLVNIFLKKLYILFSDDIEILFLPKYLYKGSL